MPADTPRPLQQGFAALFRDRALLPAELMWRWCFGASAWMLCIAFLGFYLGSLTVSLKDEFLLNTLQPALLQTALQHIFRGSLARFLMGQTMLVLGLSCLWTLAASFGRAATLARLVEMFSLESEAPSPRADLGSIFTLNFLRAAWTMISLGVAIASLTIGSAALATNRAGKAAFFLVFGVALSCVFGLLLNWFFGLASLFCVRDHSNAADAIINCSTFCSRQMGRLLALGAGFLFLRAIWFGTMFFIVMAPLQLAGKIAFGWILLMIGLLALAYFAGADLLYLARLGAYAALAEQDAQPPEPEPIPVLPPPPPLLNPLAPPAPVGNCA